MNVADNFKQLFLEKGNHAVLLDVRTPEEFQSGHFKGAVNLDLYLPDIEDRILALDKARAYFVYCHSGNRSSQTVGFMKNRGFGEVYDLPGGIAAHSSLLPLE